MGVGDREWLAGNISEKSCGEERMVGVSTRWDVSSWTECNGRGGMRPSGERDGDGEGGY